MTNHSRRTVLGLLGTAPVAAAGLLSAGTAARADSTAPADPSLADRIAGITGRAQFAGSRWGMRFQVAGGDPVYLLDPDKQFVAASAFKVFVAGSAFSALGPGHRFRTTVHRTGPVVRGSLRGWPGTGSDASMAGWSSTPRCSARAPLTSRTGASSSPSRP